MTAKVSITYFLGLYVGEGSTPSLFRTHKCMSGKTVILFDEIVGNGLDHSVRL